MNKQYFHPATEVMDLCSEKMMLGGMSLVSGGGGGGSGHADAPARRGQPIEWHPQTP